MGVTDRNQWCHSPDKYLATDGAFTLGALQASLALLLRQWWMSFNGPNISRFSSFTSFSDVAVAGVNTIGTIGTLVPHVQTSPVVPRTPDRLYRETESCRHASSSSTAQTCTTLALIVAQSSAVAGYRLINFV